MNDKTIRFDGQMRNRTSKFFCYLRHPEVVNPRDELRYFRFSLVAISCAFDAMCVAATLTLTENIQAEFDLEYTKTSWCLTAYSISFAGFIAFFGRVGDIVGNNRLFVVSSFFFAIFSVLCAAVPHFIAFAVFRALQGVAGAGIVPSSFAMISVLFDDKEAVVFLSVLSFIFAGFNGIGLVLGGAFAASSSGYKGMFYFIFAVMFLVSLISAFMILPYDSDGEKSSWKTKLQNVNKLDFVGSAMFVVSSILIVIGLTEGGESWRDPASYAVLIAGIAVFVAFFLWNVRYAKVVDFFKKCHCPRLSFFLSERMVLIPQEVIELKNFMPAMIMVFLNYCIFFSCIYIVNQYNLYSERNSAIIASIKVLPVIVGLFCSNVMIIIKPSILSPKVGITLGFFVMLGSSIIFIQLHLVHQKVFWKLFFTAGFMCGFGSALFFTYVLKITIGVAPYRLKGLASGVMQTFGQFGTEVSFSVLASILGNISATGQAENTSRLKFQNCTYFTLTASALGVLLSMLTLFRKDKVVNSVPEDEDENSELHSQITCITKPSIKNSFTA